MNYSEVSFVQSAFSLGQLPSPEYPEAAFVGRSNVGKSSLMNCLMRRKKFVKISARPGKTQSLNYFLVDRAAYFVDLPGYGYARVSKNIQEKWSRLIEEYLLSRKTLRCVVVIVDLRHGPSRLDTDIVRWLEEHDLPFLLVYTKADKLSRNQQQINARLLDEVLVGPKSRTRILFSSKTGEGRDSLHSSLSVLLFAEDIN